LTGWGTTGFGVSTIATAGGSMAGMGCCSKTNAVSAMGADSTITAWADPSAGTQHCT
jgi:hypothetical protein